MRIIRYLLLSPIIAVSFICREISYGWASGKYLSNTLHFYIINSRGDYK